MLTRLRTREEGQLMVLVIVYAAIAATLVVAVIDMSIAFLARRSLSSVADGAALAAAQAVDRPALYRGGAGNGVLPLSRDSVAVAVDRYLDDSGAAADLPGLQVVEAAPTPDGTAVVVTFRRPVRLPFLAVLGLAGVAPEFRDGTVDVETTAHARAPLQP